MPTILIVMAMLFASRFVLGDHALAARDARRFDEIVLEDHRGKAYRLSDFKDAPALVVAFLGVECPLAKVYARRLAGLVAEYSPRGVAFLGVDSNQQDSLEELGRFAAATELAMPLVKDPGNRLADALGAARTPEVCVLDREGQIRYQGRVDDQFEIGIQRPRPTREDLKLALDAVLAGQSVEIVRTPIAGCLIGRVREPRPDAEVTWNGQIAGIVQEHCQECHRPGQVGPFSLLTYDDAVGWSEMVGEVVATGRMPPWQAAPGHGKFANDTRLSDEQKTLIAQWVAAGAPRGSEEPPPPRVFSPQWRIPEPDAVVYMSDKPFEVPTEGIVEYKWFHADPGFTEDKWVVAAEARPSAREVVHHVTVYLKPPGVPFDLRMNDRINLLVGYNPGGDPWQAPAGMAMRIPAGSELVFENHYTPNGTPQADRSCVGLVFTDPGKVVKEIHSVMPANNRFEIPPGAPDHLLTASFAFPDDALLLVMRPHMHLRGKSFRYTAVYPQGAREVLLDVPRYDFNWQNNYVLAEPKRLPAGTRLLCEATYDNSAGNPNNPDPQAAVHWGDQSTDEMMIGIFAMAWADEDRLAPKPRPSPALPSVAVPVAVAAVALIGAVALLVRLRRRVLT